MNGEGPCQGLIDSLQCRLRKSLFFQFFPRDPGGTIQRSPSHAVGGNLLDLFFPVSQPFESRRDRGVDDLEVPAAGELLEFDEREIRFDPGRVAAHDEADGPGGSDHRHLGVAIAVGLSQGERLVPDGARRVEKVLGTDARVESLRGTVDVESVEGQGSVLRIRLPLTLAIIEGMVVSVSRQPYIVPVLAIVESIRPRAQDIKRVSGQGEVLFFRDEYLPLYRLYDWLDHEPVVTDPTQGIVLVVEDSAGRRALMADDLLGQQQVVIKNLEDNFTKLAGISGATILAEGNVALILDILGLYYHRNAGKEMVA